MYTLVLIESPKKRAILQGYLGSGYRVEASVGHIRDLPASLDEVPAASRAAGWTSLAVRVDDESYTPLYVVRKPDVVARLRAALRDADRVLLATDADREGEAIAWHLLQVLRPSVPVARVAFTEITRAAVSAAVAAPRSIDRPRVAAQEARRIVDRLYGWGVSPALWDALGRRLSAGRVQSPALRLVVDRERARAAHRTREWHDLVAGHGTHPPFSSVLVSVGGRPLGTAREIDPSTGAPFPAAAGRFWPTRAEAEALAARFSSSGPAEVRSVSRKVSPEAPRPPLTTSALQQSAHAILRFSPAHTMQVAQQLYEQGWITYMRTDAVHLAPAAVDAARVCASERYGIGSIPESPRHYTASASAQEAHEAIRPAGLPFRDPESATACLPSDLSRLYGLIWRRTVASQMVDAQVARSTVTLAIEGAEFVATGREVVVPGHRAAHVEDPRSAADRLLPSLAKGDRVPTSVQARSHLTEPPGRYTEASLVRALEERGIGRPSTYAAILHTLSLRGMVRIVQGALVPTPRAVAVIVLLERVVGPFVDDAFTARMEFALDAVARGEVPARTVLSRFYRGTEEEEGLASRIGRRERGEVRFPWPGVAGEVCADAGGVWLVREDGSRRIPEDFIPDRITEAWAVRTPTSARSLPAPEGGGVRGLMGTDGRAILIAPSPEGLVVQRGRARRTLSPGRSASSWSVGEIEAILGRGAKA